MKKHNTFLTDFEYDYRKAGTADLFDTLRMMRVLTSSGQYWSDDSYEYRSIKKKHKKQIAKMVVALKTELAKRPHLPNSKERKAIRRLKAQGRYVRE
jgi:hypothetical protein